MKKLEKDGEQWYNFGEKGNDREKGVSMYRLIAIDLDGTLLNSYGEISQKNKEAIQYAKQKGAEIVLCSGRVNSVGTLAEEIQADRYIICGNGSLLYDLKENKILYSKEIDKAKLMQILSICEENSIFYNVYTEDTILTKSLNYNVLFYNQENLKKPEEKKTNIQIIPDLYHSIEKNEKDHFLKVTICDDNEIIFGSIIRKLRNIKNVDTLDVEHMSRKMFKSGTEEVKLEYYYTEITSQNVNKWNALSFLMEKLEIKPEEVLAIGDNINDESMLKNAEMGIAMGNSAPYIQEFANAVVADNNSDGVAEAIYQYL